jgi:hypothetical protein
MSRFSWIALVAAIVIGIGVTLLLKERTGRAIAELEAQHDWDSLHGRKPQRPDVADGV